MALRMTTVTQNGEIKRKFMRFYKKHFQWDLFKKLFIVHHNISRCLSVLKLYIAPSSAASSIRTSNTLPSSLFSAPFSSVSPISSATSG